MRYKYHFIFMLPIIFTAVSCGTTAPAEEEAELPGLQQKLDIFFSESETFRQSTTGFVLYDPDADSVLYGRDEHRFFTPASNAKTFTLYAALNTLPDTLASIRYESRNDTLYFRGTGDPSFLHPDFKSSKTFDFLKNRPETLAYYDAHFQDDHFGSGWPWDWYPQAFAPEKTPFPVYGNMIRLNRQSVALIILNEEKPVEPAFFERFLDRKEWDGPQVELVKREFRKNTLSYVPRSDTVSRVQNMPFVYSPELITDLLADTLGRPVYYQNGNGLQFPSVMYDFPAKPLYERMMLESDNFIAEQLLLMIADKIFGEMNTGNAIGYITENHLSEYRDEFHWADGSGLTRYNLVTPRAMAGLMNRFLQRYGEDAVRTYFPAGGGEGTLRSWFRPEPGEPPWVYAKTGTLRNNTSLSGYLYTDSGKLLIFTFLNNNYIVSNNTLRNEMQNVLHMVKENY